MLEACEARSCFGALELSAIGEKEREPNSPRRYAVAATRLAVPNITGEDLRGLEESLDQITALDPANSDYAKIDRLNQSFHFGLYDRANNRRLLEMIRSLWDSVVRYRARNTQIEGFLARSTQDHRAILEALRRKGGQEAEKLMQAHLCMSRDSLLEQIAIRQAERLGNLVR